MKNPADGTFASLLIGDESDHSNKYISL